MGARCVAHDLHAIAPWPLERMCWRRFAALWGDCKKSRIVPLNAIIIIIIIIIIIKGVQVTCHQSAHKHDCAFDSLLPLHSQLYLWVHHFGWDFFVYVTVFQSKLRDIHILSSWSVHAGCVFVAGIHLSRTWMSESFESVQSNACVHRLDLGLYSHPKEFYREWSQNPC